MRWCCFLLGSCFHILSRKSEGWFFRARTRKWVAHFRCLFTTFFQWPVAAALVCFMLIPTHKYHKFSLPSRPYCCKGSRWRWCKPFFSEEKREINASRFDRKSFHLVATAAGFSCMSSEDMPGFFNFEYALLIASLGPARS